MKATFLENKFDEKYLLIGDFLPVSEGSKVKLAKVYTNTGWGYIDQKGNEIVKPVYKQITSFYNGYVMASEQLFSEYDWHSTEFPLIINYWGKILTSSKDYIYKIQYKDRYQKDFFITSKNKKNGILSIAGKELVPFDYTEISYSDNFFFAYNYSDFENGICEFDIYKKNGDFVKKITSKGIREIGDYLINYDVDGTYFLNKKNLKRIDNRTFNNIFLSENSSKFKYEVEIYHEKTDYTERYFLNNRLRIISPDFPNSYIYEDRFLVKPYELNNIKKFIVADLSNNKIAEYSFNDFILYQYFAHGKLDNPKFLKSQKPFWNTLTISKTLMDNQWMEYYKNIEYRKRFAKFTEKNENNIQISTGYIDANTGKIVIKRNIKDVTYIESLDDTEFFQIKYDNKDVGQLDVFNSKDSLVRSFSGNYINSNYNYLNKTNATFFILNKGKDSLNKKSMISEQLLRRKDLKPIFADEKMFVKTTAKNYAIFGFNKDLKMGLIDNHNRIIRPADYQNIFAADESQSTDILILQKQDNHNEIIDAKTFEPIIDITFKIGITKKHGYYRDGIYLINEKKNVMDRYGNIITTPPNFDLFRD
ncbi:MULTISPECIES: WG repeat-containing protein [unclassified Chryseobacterium]|uniref:WG repeat-containing protein n=1 Tax=unclassified Chryseobacterium TaxID=2593645 RepID=UPI0012FF4979|nr:MULTISPECIES: WG repeat-containing protein [unclassified Chryseobacterium]